MDIERFRELPLMGIMRDVAPGDIIPLIEVSAGSGLRTLEITMNTPGAAELIKKAADVSRGRLSIGAGTVVSKELLEEALGAGAGFIVTPVYIEEVVDTCRRNKIPVFPGALTPREVFEAWRGFTGMVKVFPACAFGPSYFKSLKGPFDKIELMAVGGVGPGDVKDYFAGGADAVAFGAGVFKKEWIEKKDHEAIGGLVRRYVEEVKKAVNADGRADHEADIVER